MSNFFLPQNPNQPQQNFQDLQEAEANARIARARQEQIKIENLGLPTKKRLTPKERQFEEQKAKIASTTTRQEREQQRELIDAVDADQTGAVPHPLPELETFEGYEFPTECLGQELEQAVHAIAEIGQAHPDIAAQAILGALSLAIQAHVDVLLPINEVRPVSLFLVTVAASGDRKTTADRKALKAVEKYEQDDLAPAFKRKITIYDLNFKEYEKQKHRIMENEHYTQERKEAEVLRLKEPVPPAPPLFRTQEPTMAGLRDQFIKGCCTLGLFSDDGGDFLGGHAMQKDNEKSTIATLSKLWEGAPWTPTRAGGFHHNIFGRRVTMHLMIQPKIAEEFFGNELFQSQGILSRMLMSHPPTLSGQRECKEVDPIHEVNLNYFHAKLYSILQREPTYKSEDKRELAPRQLKFSAEAFELWKDFQNGNQRPLREGRFNGIQGFIEKSLEHAARIAALLTFWYYPASNEISGFVFQKALIIIDYYINHQLAQIAVSSQNITIANAHKLYLWLNEKCEEEFVSIPYLQKFSPIRDKQSMVDAVELLEQCNLFTNVGPGRIVRGQPTKKSWKVIRDVF